MAFCSLRASPRWSPLLAALLPSASSPHACAPMSAALRAPQSRPISTSRTAHGMEEFLPLPLKEGELPKHAGAWEVAACAVRACWRYVRACGAACAAQRLCARGAEVLEGPPADAPRCFRLRSLQSLMQRRAVCTTLPYATLTHTLHPPTLRPRLGRRGAAPQVAGGPALPVVPVPEGAQHAADGAALLPAGGADGA